MRLSRREFLRAGSGVGFGVIWAGTAWGRLGQPTPPAPARQVKPGDIRYFEWKKAVDGVQVAFGEGGNAMLLIGAGESLLVDTKNAGFGDALRKEALALGTKLAMVINTHHHADHTGGNSSFTKDVPVLAHAKAKARIAGNAERYTAGAKATVAAMFKSTRLAAPSVRESAMMLAGTLDELKEPAKIGALFEPTRTTEGNEALTVGGKKVELTHVGAGHTDNDLIVFLPEHNVLHTGDLVFHKTWPYIDRAGGATTEGWIRSCEKIVSMCNDKTVVVPGHGDLTDRSGVRAQIDFFKAMREVAAKAVKDGATRDEFLKRPFDEYKDYALADFIKPVTLGGLYDEAAGTPAR